MAKSKVTKTAFSAHDARAATRRFTMDNARLDKLQALIEAKVKAACSQGRNSLHEPFADLSEYRQGPEVATSEEREALRARFVALGYKFNDHADPDPGHPCSRPYTTMSW